MTTIEVKRDVVYGDGDKPPYIIVGVDALIEFKANTSKQKDPALKKNLQESVKFYESERARCKDLIKPVAVTMRRPSPEDRIEIRSQCVNSQGIYNAEREPLEVAARLITAWTMFDEDGQKLELSEEGVRKSMPLCMLDLLYSSILPYLYPSQERLAFLPPSVA